MIAVQIPEQYSVKGDKVVTLKSENGINDLAAVLVPSLSFMDEQIGAGKLFGREFIADHIKDSPKDVLSSVRRFAFEAHIKTLDPHQDYRYVLGALHAQLCGWLNFRNVKNSRGPRFWAVEVEPMFLAYNRTTEEAVNIPFDTVAATTNTITEKDGSPIDPNAGLILRTEILVGTTVFYGHRRARLNTLATPEDIVADYSTFIERAETLFPDAGFRLITEFGEVLTGM